MKLTLRLSPRVKLLGLAGAFSMFWGAIELGEPLDAVLKGVRDTVRARPADGSIVVVGVDGKTLSKLGTSARTRVSYARMIDQLMALGAKRVSFDHVFSDKMTPAEDAVFVATLKRHRGKIALGQAQASPELGWPTALLPRPEFAKWAETPLLNGEVGAFQLNARFPDRANSPDGPLPIAMLLADRKTPPNGYYRPDFSIQASTIPTISMVDVLDGKVPRSAVAGKDVVLGMTDPFLRDYHLLFMQGQVPGVYFHVIAAQTLKEGDPMNLGWLPLELLAIVLAVWITYAPANAKAGPRDVIALLALGVVPFVLQMRLIETDVTPALALVIPVMIGANRIRRSETRKDTDNLTGLPSIEAIKKLPPADDQAVIALKILNYDQISTSLDAAADEELFAQVCRRIAIDGGSGPIYHHHDTLAWLRPIGSAAELREHLAGLRKIASHPFSVGGRTVDVSLAIGADCSVEASWSRRVNFALAAASTAGRTTRGWHVTDIASHQDDSWHLSLVSELEVAVDNGDIWLAFQPKLDLLTGKITGAEALARWQHPERGLIMPTQFIEAAEQHNRIEKLTHYVLDRAVQAAAQINARGYDFKIAVNVSARLAPSSDLVEVALSALQRHGLPASKLILEITETAALDVTPQTLATLLSLTEAGIVVSIDDYGTGNATMDYLTTLPAQELKIDRSFVSDMEHKPEHQIIVESTIRLAHQLGRRVVAEGVESVKVLNMLEKLSCDTVQGYFVGRPMKFDELVTLLDARTKAPRRRRKAA